MTVSPGPPTDPATARAVRELRQRLRDELPRVRSAAVAWRNGLAGLLTALVGFSLIRGRSDIGQLAGPWNVIVGILLLAALLAGTVAGLSLLRAANGRPAMTSYADALPVPVADHIEAGNAVRALRRGIAMSLSCAALLVAAVGTTWYGPAKGTPQLEIMTSRTTVCGTVIRFDSGMITVRSEVGEVSLNLSEIQAIRPTVSCPAGDH
jgi:hypothetical protein